MKKVFRIHGYGGEPNGGWAPWLLGELAKKDIWACAPQMPTPEYPKPEEWIKEITRQIDKPSEDIILVGHSLGATGILRYLETLSDNDRLGGVVLVSGFMESLPLERHRPLDIFVMEKFDVEKIKKTAGKITIVHAKDDPSVPFSIAENMSKELGCDLIALDKGGHLSGSSGCYELPEVLEAVLNII